MQESLYQTVDSGCRKHSIRQRMQKPLYQTADAGNTLITQRMQDTLYQKADAEVSLLQSGCRSLSIR